MEKVINRVRSAAAGHPENMNTLPAKLLSKDFRSLLTLSSAVRRNRSYYIRSISYRFS